MAWSVHHALNGDVSQSRGFSGWSWIPRRAGGSSEGLVGCFFGVCGISKLAVELEVDKVLLFLCPRKSEVNWKRSCSG